MSNTTPNRFKVHRRGMIENDPRQQELVFKESFPVPGRVYRIMGENINLWTGLIVDVVGVAWVDGSVWLVAEHLSEMPLKHFEDQYISPPGSQP